MARRRLTRAQGKERTRGLLLDAAARVFRGRGYRGATVDEIAAEAGYTIGALYSNFAGKDDVLLALLEREIAGVVERIATAAGRESDLPGKLRRGALEWIAILDDDPDLYVLLIEFWTLWVRDPGLRPAHAKRFAALRQAIGELVDAEVRRAGGSLRMPAEQVGATVVALADGLAVQHLADPEALPDDLLASVLAILVPLATAAPARGS